jgi:hypothetical protein
MLEFSTEAVVFFRCLLKVEVRYYALLVLQEACTHTLAVQYFIPLSWDFSTKISSFVGAAL